MILAVHFLSGDIILFGLCCIGGFIYLWYEQWQKDSKLVPLNTSGMTDRDIILHLAERYEKYSYLYHEDIYNNLKAPKKHKGYARKDLAKKVIRFKPRPGEPITQHELWEGGDRLEGDRSWWKAVTSIENRKVTYPERARFLRSIAHRF